MGAVKSPSSSIVTPTDMMLITFANIIAAKTSHCNKTSQIDTKMGQKEIHALLQYILKILKRKSKILTKNSHFPPFIKAFNHV